MAVEVKDLQDLIDSIDVDDELIERDTQSRKISDALKGLNKSAESRFKMSESAKRRNSNQKGLKRSDLTKSLISEKRWELSAERRREISSKGGEWHKGKPKPKYECPHCKKMIAANMFDRYHNDNCKSKPND